MHFSTVDWMQVQIFNKEVDVGADSLHSIVDVGANHLQGAMLASN
jgi:hypothetical protein